MTALTGECCGHGRDQLAYNLEFLRIAALEDRALDAIRPTATTALVMDDRANWFAIGPVDSETFRRTLRKSNALHLREVGTWALGETSPMPDELVYFAFDHVDNLASLQRLLAWYTTTRALVFDEQGYALNVYQMVRRPR